MTSQKSDHLIVEGAMRPIAAATPIPFIPADYDLLYGGWSTTNCYRGFWVRYRLNGDELSIDQLDLVAHPRNLASLLGGKLFGCTPTRREMNMLTYENVSFPYTGQLVVNSDLKSARLKPRDNYNEIFTFANGQLESRQLLASREIPSDFITSDVWANYGELLWKQDSGPNPDMSILAVPLEELESRIRDELENNDMEERI
jgi:hypothetical protein